MNIHHLELFYYVARHGGIMEAVRNMPYGIQQPAVSGQILQLESDLGVKLFQRRPFELTPAGYELYQFVLPFFSKVDEVGEKIRGGVTQTIRMAAPEVALRDHLPEVLEQVRRKFPKLKLTLRGAHQPQVESWLEKQEVDFAITILEGKPAPGLNSEPLLEIPMAFLVPESHPFRTAAQVLDALASGVDAPPLITLPPNELVPQLFREHLAQRGIEWPPSIEVTALELIDVYVGGGFGVGLTLAVPRFHPAHSAPLRYIPVPELPALTVGALWRGPMVPVTMELLSALRQRAQVFAKRIESVVSAESASGIKASGTQGRPASTGVAPKRP